MTGISSGGGGGRYCIDSEKPSNFSVLIGGNESLFPAAPILDGRAQGFNLVLPLFHESGTASASEATSSPSSSSTAICIDENQEASLARSTSPKS
jgi:hypothetical protein